ncbi:hypothetical protein FWH30_00625 [Microgenomates group bacterium]|nr:hypothetical protein [Microgenomates group bacterium]
MSNVLPSEKIILTFVWSEIEPLYNKAISKLSSKVKMDGFRAGKVPVAIAKKQLSFEAIVNQTLSTILIPRFNEEMTKKKITPVGQPQLMVHKAAEGDNWEVEVQYALEPAIKLGDYQKLLAKHKKEAAKKIAQQKKAILAQHEELQKKDPKHEIPNLEPTTDEQKQQEQDQITDMAVAGLLGDIEVPVHEILITQQTEHQLGRFMGDLAQHNIEVDAYLKNINQTKEEFIESVKKQAQEQIELHFLLEAIKKDTKIKTQEDLVDFLRKI